MKIMLMEILKNKPDSVDTPAYRLKGKLLESGHQVELVELPFTLTRDEKSFEQIFAYSLLKCDDAEALIAFTFPTYFVPHKNKKIWIAHKNLVPMYIQDRLSPTHDLFQDDFFSKLKAIDSAELKKNRSVFSGSKVISKRLEQYNGVTSEVLYPPLLNIDHYHCADAEDYLLFPTRLETPEVWPLVIERMRFAKSNLKLIIKVNSDSVDAYQSLNQYIIETNLHMKVQLVYNGVNQIEHAGLFNHALGVLVDPSDSDSVSTTLEAFAAHKPVISFEISGTQNDFFENAINAWIVTTDAQMLASAMNRLYENKAEAKRMGNAGYEIVRGKNISWDYVIQRLLA